MKRCSIAAVIFVLIWASAVLVMVAQPHKASAMLLFTPPPAVNTGKLPAPLPRASEAQLFTPEQIAPIQAVQAILNMRAKPAQIDMQKKLAAILAEINALQAQLKALQRN